MVTVQRWIRRVLSPARDQAPIGFALLLMLPAGGAVADERALDLAGARLVDLTWTLGEETLYWPTSPSRFELQVLAHGETEAGFFYAANSFCTPEHGGTHLDAPIHFARDRWTAEEIPVERLAGPLVVIDVSEAAAEAEEYLLSSEDVNRYEEAHGRIAPGSIVMLRTGWDRFWPEARAYLGDDTPGDASKLRFPSYGVAAVQLLVERGVAALGVDTASIDPGSSTDFPVHRLANEANLYGLENVARLGEVPASGAWVFALPTKIEGGSGAPVRIVAVVGRSTQ